MTFLARLSRALQPPAVARQAKALASLDATARALQDEVSGMRHRLADVSSRLSSLHDDTLVLLGGYRDEVNEQARMGALAGARLAADGIRLLGSPSARLQVRRVRSGEAVDLPFTSQMGLTRVVSTAPDVRDLWDRLRAREAGCADDRLRGAASTVLDVRHATIEVATPHTLDVTLDGAARPDRVVETRTVAVPRLTYHFAARKLRNFGHWLLDGVPQIVALDALAPDAVFLLPDPLRNVYRATLGLLGIGDDRIRPWDGQAVACDRVLVLEDDGRAGGGRPLSALLETRRRLVQRASVPDRPPATRIYVSRRDAKRHRRWVANEAEVEALFASLGFVILSMADCALSEQVRLFSSARVIAGVSGAGLADIVFAPPGAHVITLVSDDLMRWYADEGQSRALWASPAAPDGGELARLGDSPRFYGHVAAAFGQISHYYVGPDQVSVEQLSDFLGEVLAQVDKR